jgi:hypothetical protein
MDASDRNEDDRNALLERKLFQFNKITCTALWNLVSFIWPIYYFDRFY